MKYKIKGKRLIYNGFILDVGIVILCLIIGLSSVVALITRRHVQHILLGIVCEGYVLNILLMIKFILRRRIVLSVIMGIFAACLLAFVIYGGLFIL